MKEWLCAALGAIGSYIAMLFGGWSSALATLLIFMGVDFLTGLITGAMGKSDNTESGKLSAKACFAGLAKKFCVLLLLVVAVRLDIMLDTSYIADAVCLAFCCNELLSILENMGQMGVPLPKMLKNAIETLEKKVNDE